jgi:anti-sigma-K factor RskA
VVEKVQVVEVAAPPPRVPTPGERRAELLAQAPDARTIDWSVTPDPAAKGANGDVVWSESRQQGYMRIRGLAANDPKATQYQLWIFDGKRDQAHPVDGGVFDVVDGEVVVPIRAAIRVFEPKLFAVTVEKPGGVVVSKRERIVLTAAM